MNYKEIKEILKNGKWEYIGKYPHRYKCYKLEKKENKEIKIFLKENRFFEFFISNNGIIVYEHQIIAFFCCGGLKALNNGFKSNNNLSTKECLNKEAANYEVHHINSNTFDNHPKNLIFLPNQIHQIVTKGQRRIYKYLKVFGKKLGMDFLDYCLIFNRKGNIVKRIYEWITCILCLSILETSKFRNIEISIKGLYKFAKFVLKNLNFKICPSFTKSYFLTLCIN